MDNALFEIERYKIPSEKISNVVYGNEKYSPEEQRIIEDKRRLEEYKKRVASKSTLSNETEKQLRDIAREKGIEIEEFNEREYLYATLTKEERKFIEQVEDYLRKHGRLK
jgi:hypothetical protein